jgi:hypothetical protein
MSKGRKKHSGDRFDCGKLRLPVDHGTEAMQIRRAQLAGKDGDPALTTHPLGILYARELIDRDQYSAGCRYERLYALMIGKPTSATAYRDDERRGAGFDDDDDWESRRDKRDGRNERSFVEATAVLKAISRKAKTLVDNIAVYGRCPAWAIKALPTLSEYRERDLLLIALDRLAVLFGHVQRGKAA